MSFTMEEVRNALIGNENKKLKVLQDSCSRKISDAIEKRGNCCDIEVDHFASSLVSSQMKTIIIKKNYASVKVVARRYVCIFNLSTYVEERFGGNWGIHAFFYKNILYKNIEAENSQKIKNILRIC